MDITLSQGTQLIRQDNMSTHTHTHTLLTLPDSTLGSPKCARSKYSFPPCKITLIGKPPYDTVRMHAYREGLYVPHESILLWMILGVALIALQKESMCSESNHMNQM